jgi:hypothetical protein
VGRSCAAADSAHLQEAPPLQPPQPASPSEEDKMPSYDEHTQALIDGEAWVWVWGTPASRAGTLCCSVCRGPGLLEHS